MGPPVKRHSNVVALAADHAALDVKQEIRTYAPGPGRVFTGYRDSGQKLKEIWNFFVNISISDAKLCGYMF